MVEKTFVEKAMSLGVDRKIAVLIADCDRALIDLPADRDRRWQWRIEGHRRLLLAPSLRTLVALATRICEETPSLAPSLAPALADLVRKHPEFLPFQARILDPDGAKADKAGRRAA